MGSHNHSWLTLPLSQQVINTVRMIPDKKSKFFTYPKIFFYILSIAVFIFAIRYLGKFNDIGALILQIDPLWLALALVFQVLTYATNAMTLFVLLKGIKFFTLFKISIVIMFVNQALPTGGLSGNGYVLTQLLKRKVTAPIAYFAIITQTICYYIAIILALAIFYSCYLNYSAHVNRLITYTVILGFLYFSILGSLMILISNQHTLHFLKIKLSKFSIIRNYLKKLKFSATPKDQPGLLKRLLMNKRSTATIILLQMLVIFFDISTLYAIIKGFHVNLPIEKVSLALLLSQVIGALPISPGSLIAYESAMTYFLTTLGSPVHAALIITLLFRFLTFWLPIPVGLFLYRNLAKHKRQL